MEELNRSLHQEDQIKDLLDRFEQEIRVVKCDTCKFTCSGSKNLREHIESHHLRGVQSSSPDPALPSLGDYLASLETKIDQCNDYILKQSVIASKKSVMIEKLLALAEEKLPEKEDEVVQFFKCVHCSFETEDRCTFNDHRNQEHQGTHRWDVPHKCTECNQQVNSKERFDTHMREEHTVESDMVKCPMCKFENSLETVVTKHVDEKHPDMYSCKQCTNNFTNQTELDRHVGIDHIVDTNTVKYR